MTKRPTRPDPPASAGAPRSSGGGRARLPTGVMRPKDEHSLEARARKFRNGEGFLVPPDSARPPSVDALDRPPPITASASAQVRLVQPLDAPLIADMAEETRGAGLVRPGLFTALAMLVLVIGIGIAVAYVLFHPATYPVDPGTRTVEVPKSRDTLTYDLAKRPMPEIRGAWRRLETNAPPPVPTPTVAEPMPANARHPLEKVPAKGAAEPILVEPPKQVEPPETTEPSTVARMPAPTIVPPAANAPASPTTVAPTTPVAHETEPSATAHRKAQQPTITPEPVPKLATQSPATVPAPTEVAAPSSPSETSPPASMDSGVPREVAADPTPGDMTTPADAQPERGDQPSLVATGSLPQSPQARTSPPVQGDAKSNKRDTRQPRGPGDRRQVKRPAGKVAKINRSEPASPRTSLDGPGNDVFERTFGGFARVRP